VIYQVMIEH